MIDLIDYDKGNEDANDGNKFVRTKMRPKGGTKKHRERV